MIIAELLAFLLCGLLAGVLAGLLGIGGGILFVPIQVFIYSLAHMPEAIRMKVAVATSLATIIFSTASSARSHAKRGNVRWDLIYKIAVGVLIGAIAGTVVVRIMPDKVLEIIFGLFLICVSLHTYFKKSLYDHPETQTPSYPIFNTIGFAIGTFAASMGVGGGLLMIPTLTHYHVPLRKAIGTASVLGFLLSFFGAIAFLFPSFYGVTIALPYSIGYVYFPALIPMAIGSMLTAPFGVHLTHTLPVDVIKRIFSCFTGLVGLLMIFR